MRKSKLGVTAALEACNRGEPGALESLIPLVFDDLRAVAQTLMKSERPAHTLQPTALVNELCLALFSRKRPQWENRAEFFGFAGGLLRRLLVDHARRRNCQKRGGQLEIVPLTGPLDVAEPNCLNADTVLDVDQALEELEQVDPLAVKIVELKYFAGMNEKEIMKALDIERGALQKDWNASKLFLSMKLSSYQKKR